MTPVKDLLRRYTMSMFFATTQSIPLENPNRKGKGWETVADILEKIKARFAPKVASRV